MKRILLAMHLLVLVAALVLPGGARANDLWINASAVVDNGAPLFSPEELEDLLAPVALYPDPLLAQILPAATFVDQIDDAARYVRLYGRTSRIDYQPWDVSVRAIAHYPDVLYMMDRRYDWTVALGQAYINQPDEVMDAIQRLREDALEMGNLISTSQQQVIIEGGDIRIVPAQPAVIYVPTYDPEVVYVERPSSYAFISFGIGLSIGAWLNRDCDWRDHRVYYHGWRDGGWIGRARPHVIDRRNVTINNIYINNNVRTVNVNRRVMQHDNERFRQNIRRAVEQRRTIPGRPVPQQREQRQPGREERRGTPRTTAPAQPAPRPAAGQPTHAPRPGVTPAPQPAPRQEQRGNYRGRAPQPGQPAQSVIYGGYGNSKDAKSYRERGQSSRGIQQAPRQAPRPAASPTPAAAPPRPAPVPAQSRPAPQPRVAPAPAVKSPPQQSAPRQAPAVKRGGEQKREIQEERGQRR